LAGATTHFQIALLLNPSQVATSFDLALVLAQQQQFSAAAAACQHVCRLDPGHADARALLASLNMALGSTRQALDDFREALRLQPDKLQWQVQLALALATSQDPHLRNVDEALRWADRALRAAGTNADRLRDLSTVYAACGRASQAAEVAREAAQLYQAAGPPDAPGE
jgi:tetratricopeptide (TPR) repeat protein